MIAEVKATLYAETTVISHFLLNTAGTFLYWSLYFPFLWCGILRHLHLFLPPSDLTFFMRTFLIIQFKSTTSLEFFILSPSFSYLYNFYHIKCYYFTHLLGMLDISPHPNIRSITEENFAEFFNLYIHIFTVFNLVNVYTQLTLINI